MLLFHASKSDFLVGQVFDNPRPTTYYPDAVVEMENHRPTHAPSRSSCFFTSDREDFAVFFLLRQGGPLADIRLYAVNLPVYWKAPFAITHALHRRIEKSQPTQPLVAEYWQQHESWIFYEFFGPRMIIEEIRPLPDIKEMSLTYRYSIDTDLASTL